MTHPQTTLLEPPPCRLEMLTPKLLAAVAGEPSFYGAIAAIAEGFVDIFGALAANVRVLRADGRTLDLISACGLGAGDESTKIDIADATPAGRAVRTRSIQFMSAAPVPRSRAARLYAVSVDTLVSLPLVGDERIFGAVSGYFDVPLARGDCEQLAGLGQILGGLMEIGLLGQRVVEPFDSPRRRRRGKSGSW